MKYINCSFFWRPSTVSVQNYLKRKFGGLIRQHFADFKCFSLYSKATGAVFICDRSIVLYFSNKFDLKIEFQCMGNWLYTVLQTRRNKRLF
jgi:hypothetical protein